MSNFDQSPDRRASISNACVRHLKLCWQNRFLSDQTRPSFTMPEGQFTPDRLASHTRILPDRCNPYTGELDEGVWLVQLGFGANSTGAFLFQL
jgi:hypothetical protein